MDLECTTQSQWQWPPVHARGARWQGLVMAAPAWCFRRERKEETSLTSSTAAATASTTGVGTSSPAIYGTYYSFLSSSVWRTTSDASSASQLPIPSDAIYQLLCPTAGSSTFKPLRSTTSSSRCRGSCSCSSCFCSSLRCSLCGSCCPYSCPCFCSYSFPCSYSYSCTCSRGCILSHGE